MGTRPEYAILHERDHSLIFSGYKSLNQVVQKLVDSLLPGDRVDFDDIDPALRAAYIQEFFDRGYDLSSAGIMYIVETCAACAGVGLDRIGLKCLACDGRSSLVDEGRGLEPYRR